MLQAPHRQRVVARQAIRSGQTAGGESRQREGGISQRRQLGVSHLVELELRNRLLLLLHLLLLLLLLDVLQCCRSLCRLLLHWLLALLATSCLGVLHTPRLLARHLLPVLQLRASNLRLLHTLCLLDRRLQLHVAILLCPLRGTCFCSS